MYVCVFVFNCPALIAYYVSQSRMSPSGLTTPQWLHRADRLLRISIENVSKWLEYPAVVILDFCRCCHPTGGLPLSRWNNTA